MYCLSKTNMTRITSCIPHIESGPHTNILIKYVFHTYFMLGQVNKRVEKPCMDKIKQSYL